MKNGLVFLFTTLVLGLSGCAHSIHEVHVSDFVPFAEIESGKMVKAQAEQFVVLGIVDNTNYVDTAYRSIMGQCPDGQITGLTTQISTNLGFFSWTNKALIQGLCVK